MRQAGRYLPEYQTLRNKIGNLLSFFLSPKYAAQATLQPLQRFQLDAAIIFSDILILPHALGRSLVYQDKTGPQLEPLQVKDIAKLHSNPNPSILYSSAQSIEIAKESLSSDTAMIGFAGSPMSVACYMIDGNGKNNFAKTQTWIHLHLNELISLINIITEHTISLLQAQINAGAEVVQIFDSWAGIPNYRTFNKLVSEPTAKIRNALKESHPDVPVIGFPRLAGSNIIKYIEKTQVDAISLDHTIDPKLIRSILPSQFSKIPLQGNIDPLSLLHGGDSLVNETKLLMKNIKNTPHIVNLGHGILKDTPIQHVEKLIQIAKSS